MLLVLLLAHCHRNHHTDRGVHSPVGYVFLNQKTLISEKGKEYARENFQQADGHNPDLHDMYIYNGVRTVVSVHIYIHNVFLQTIMPMGCPILLTSA